eukprot:Tamp_34729.p3 GENE.Tamp_34729~~Tamp_34729.p3  ORF type:complete len:134 (-),score=17.81 Tamp_34729:193-564(-)
MPTKKTCLALLLAVSAGPVAAGRAAGKAAAKLGPVFPSLSLRLNNLAQPGSSSPLVPNDMPNEDEHDPLHYPPLSLLGWGDDDHNDPDGCTPNESACTNKGWGDDDHNDPDGCTPNERRMRLV